MDTIVIYRTTTDAPTSRQEAIEAACARLIALCAEAPHQGCDWSARLRLDAEADAVRDISRAVLGECY